MTREQLLQALEARLAETLRDYGISASVVARESEAVTMPLSFQAESSLDLSEEVLTVLQDTVRDFIEEHQLEFASAFGPPPDPRLLN